MLTAACKFLEIHRLSHNIWWKPGLRLITAGKHFYGRCCSFLLEHQVILQAEILPYRYLEILNDIWGLVCSLRPEIWWWPKRITQATLLSSPGIVWEYLGVLYLFSLQPLDRLLGACRWTSGTLDARDRVGNFWVCSHVCDNILWSTFTSAWAPWGGPLLRRRANLALMRPSGVRPIVSLGGPLLSAAVIQTH